MSNDWVKIYSSSEIHKVEIVKALLAEQHIDAVEINKKDSSYISVGEIEVYVKNEDEIIAKLVLSNNRI